MSDDAIPAGMFSAQAYDEASRETQRLCYELDITNADHIVLWLEQQLNGHVGPLAYIACRILDAHEAALATPAPSIVTGSDERAREDAAEIKRLRGLLVDPGSPPWEDARAVLVAELRKAGLDKRAERVAAALRGRDAVVETEQEVCRRLDRRMRIACDRTRAGKDYVKVDTVDWHGLMNITEQARAALHDATVRGEGE
jgi:hypothetical protein